MKEKKINITENEHADGYGSWTESRDSIIIRVEIFVDASL
jgi:hypothetical protein